MTESDEINREIDHQTLLSFFSQAPAALAVVHGPDHRYTFSNPLYEKLFNRSHEELMGRTIREVWPEIEGLGVYELFDQVFRSGEAFVADEYPVTFKRDDKEKFEEGFFNFIAHPLRNKAGEVTDIMIHAFEVTDRVLARKRIEASERQNRELIQSSPSMIALYKGEDMIIEVVNEAMLKAWGKGKDVVGRSFFNVLPEIREQGFEEMIKKVFESGQPHKSYELPVRLLRNGKMYLGYYNFIFYPRKNEAGKVTGIFHTAIEATAEAEINRTIRESEAFYRQMADLMPDKITNNDLQGNAVYFNQAWRDYSGRTNEELKNWDWNAAIHHDDLPLLWEKWRNSIATGEEHEMEYRIKNSEGQYLWQLVRGVPVKDEMGKVKMWITSSTDIQKLKEEDKRKEDFLKMVSHELKTPLTSIKGYVQVLQVLAKKNETSLPASFPLTNSLERIDSQINRLTRLVSEILDLSRLEFDRLQLEKKSFSINMLVNETVQDIQYSNSQQQIHVIHNYNCEVIGDQDRLGQVLINFITNAIKYSPGEKNVEVEISRGKKGMVDVSIRDRGIGIAEKDLERIFERFYRTHRTEEDTYSGFGIGLFLAKEIVERHEGEVRVESRLGEGSVFTFSLSCSPE